MATLGTMRTRISNELQIDATAQATEIDNAIFSAIAFYNDKDFWFLDATPTTFIMSATAQYALATILPGRSQIKEISLHLTPGRTELHYRTLSEILAMDFDEGYTGQPLYWTISNDTLMIYPTPNVTRTAEVYYSLRYSMTASASASSVWTNEAEEIIRLHAEIDIQENRTKEFDEAMRRRGRLAQVLSNTDEKTVRRRAARRIKPFM